MSYPQRKFGISTTPVFCRGNRWCGASACRVIALGLSIMLSSCSGNHSALDPSGKEAADVRDLAMAMFLGAAVIWAGVVILLIFAVRKKNAFSEKAAGRLILWGGALFPTAVLLALLSYTVWLMPHIRPWFDLEKTVHRKVEVTGEQFWWRIRYLDADDKVLFETANEIRLPVGERVMFSLQSADVIHSFWIPSLGGKMDMIPGRVNRLSLLAEKPGLYRGVCAEFCGTSHGMMGLVVEAMEPTAFVEWISSRKNASGNQQARGFTLFLNHGCAACHTIAGTPAKGVIGPNLTAFGSRNFIGAGSLPATTENIARFIREPAKFKPSVLMPHYAMLSSNETDQLASYLKGLH